MHALLGRSVSHGDQTLFSVGEHPYPRNRGRLFNRCSWRSVRSRRGSHRRPVWDSDALRSTVSTIFLAATFRLKTDRPGFPRGFLSRRGRNSGDAPLSMRTKKTLASCLSIEQSGHGSAGPRRRVKVPRSRQESNLTTPPRWPAFSQAHTGRHCENPLFSWRISPPNADPRYRGWWL